jgi:hypothetical protein
MKILSRNRLSVRRLSVLLGLAFVMGLGGTVPAAAADISSARSSIPRIHAPGSISLFSNSHSAAKAGWPVFAESWLGSLFSKLELWLKDRTHMIQFAAIAMVIGLLIIWWRKT